MREGRAEDLERVTNWLVDVVVREGRGDDYAQLPVKPAEKFWLGRLAPEFGGNPALGDRGERMAPSAVGVRLRPAGPPPWAFSVTVELCAWYRDRSQVPAVWRKTGRTAQTLPCVVALQQPATQHNLGDLESALERQLGCGDLRVRVELEYARRPDGIDELIVSCVNASPDESPNLADTGLYEVRLAVEGLVTAPYVLESLPDSFRYDRRVPAFGINCGVDLDDHGRLVTCDVVIADRHRPRFWNSTHRPPDLRFQTLATDPQPHLRALLQAHSEWGVENWGEVALQRRAGDENWSSGMYTEAQAAAAEYGQEGDRLARGLALLERDADLVRSFRLMNEAMARSARGKYDGWRPFQVGFILANLDSLLPTAADRAMVDILWFPTGGGKTETYLGLLLMAAFHDRLTGKASGLTSWTRFPLRLLSLQQTQRFANALAGAELVRRDAGLGGDPFSLGFFVGDSSTPNRIKPNPERPEEPNPNDDAMPARYRVLMQCPFCDADVRMAFDRRTWRLAHRCTGDACPWPEANLPVYIVDEEVYRFLPTVVVGTLDKVASVSLQGAMRGLVGSPWGVCSERDHGFTYGPRSERPTGCLVPGCRGTARPLPISRERFQPTFRLQDELHLLRDSLGAIDAHYERLLDRLLQEAEHPPKIVASSATLSGFRHQCDVLYGREARVFPVPGPSPGHSFWNVESGGLLRRYVAVAPRGATLEFATDRIITELQQAVRRLAADPARVCGELGVAVEAADEIVSLYGTNVIYGNTIRDVDAALRSMETQIPVSPLYTARLTGSTAFEQVRETLDRLQKPEPGFDERVHVVGASSMMSHGVDIDRLNTMVMLGMPLTAAEFIQATARIGRTWPGVVFVVHKMALERDASVFRSFGVYVRQGDRFVEPIPITRQSRRVLDRTLPGLNAAVRTHVHERNAGKALTTIRSLVEYARGGGMSTEGEVSRLLDILGLDPTADERLCRCVREWVADFHRTLANPGSAKWPNDCSPTYPPMRSLRDVEDQAAIYD